MWLWEMWLQLLQARSQQCAPHHRPRMFGHWVTQPSAHTHLSLFLLLFSLSPSRLHTLFSETMCPWGAYAMQRSNTNFTACARYNLIFSAGEMEEWAKNAPQTNNSSLSDNCSMEISPSQSFHLIWFHRRCGCANTQSLHAALVFPFVSATVRKKKPEPQMLIGSAPPEVFRVESFQNSDCSTSAEEQEFLTLCRWDACYEFLDGGDYDIVISGYVLMIVFIVPSSTSVSRAGNTGGGDVPLMTHMPSQCWWAGGKVGYEMCVRWIMRLKWNVDAWSLQGPKFATVSATRSNCVSWHSHGCSAKILCVPQHQHPSM